MSRCYRFVWRAADSGGLRAGPGSRRHSGLLRADQAARTSRSAGTRGRRAGQTSCARARWSRAGAVGPNRGRRRQTRKAAARRSELVGARKQADSDVKVRYAKKSLEVAETELRRAVDSEKRLAQSVSQSELDQLRLLVQTSRWKSKRPGSNWNWPNRRAISRRTTCGLPSTPSRSAASPPPWPASWPKSIGTRGEWVQPGQTILRMVRLDRLRAEGLVNRSRSRRHQRPAGQAHRRSSTAAKWSSPAKSCSSAPKSTRSTARCASGPKSKTPICSSGPDCTDRW